ncbi:MAG: carboxypeptidase-like regulatory domain-containing protein, partial [Thermoguttaceae bacterium]
AQTTSKELIANPEIKLDAWASVEGVIRQGGKPAPRVNINIHENRSNDPKWSFLNHDDSVETDADGRFVFPKLKPGRWLITGDYGVPTYGAVDLAPGQTLNNDFNSTGGPRGHR